MSKSPVEAIWEGLADTARYNEAIGIPLHRIEEIPQSDGSVRYFASAKRGPFDLVWQEHPCNWVSNRWFEHRRTFSRGPLALLTARLEVEPGNGGCRADYTIEAQASGLVGHALLATGFFPSAGRSFLQQADAIDAYARGRRATRFDMPPVDIPSETRTRADAIAQRIERTPNGHGLAARLVAHILDSQEVDLTQIRPLALARLWSIVPRHVVELCLEATRAGLLQLRWDLLCPRCRIAKAVVPTLDALPDGTHCDTCNIDYGRNFSRNVELSFRPDPSIRPLQVGEYCLFGPMSTPHIRVHVTVPAGETRDIETTLEPGPYRLRSLEPGPEANVEHIGDQFPEVVLGETSAEPGSPSDPGIVRLRNNGSRPRTFVVESRAWVEDALTADRVTTLQAFRDLFSDEVLRPGDEVGVARVALLFSDLKGSTELYSRVGDAGAYGLVRAHFAWLASIVREHDGAIIKTIGDAIMAAFGSTSDAVAAAIAMQDRIAGFNADTAGEPIVLKVGLHIGPCIAVTLNDRLDYFGQTVNMAARLQAQSVGGDIVLSKSIIDDPQSAELLAHHKRRTETARLKGFDTPVAFIRIEGRQQSVRGD